MKKAISHRLVKRCLTLLPLCIALLMCGCYESDDEFTVNADGSGKVEFSRIIKLGANPMGGPAGGDPEEMLRASVTELLRQWQGVEGWKDVTFSLMEDGRGEVRGTAYFPDISAFSTGQEVAALKNVTLVRDGDQSLRILFDEQDDGEASGEGAGEKAQLSEEEIKKAILAKRAEYQAQKPMMAMFLGDLKIVRRFRVPGRITKVGILRKDSDSQAVYSLEGERLLEGLDEAMMDDRLMREEVLSSSSQEDIPPSLEEKIFGEKGPALIETEGPFADLFDYRAEVREAKDLDQTLMALGLLEGVHQAGSTGEGQESPPPPTAGDIQVSARAALSTMSGSRKGRVYSNPVEVEIDFTGGASRDALSFGNVTLSSVIDGNGNPMEVIKYEPGSELPEGFVFIDRTKRDFFSKKPIHPDGGFGMKVILFRPEEGISQINVLAGEVTVKTARTISVGSLITGGGKVAVKHPELDAMGSFTLSGSEGGVTVFMEGTEDALDGVAVMLRNAEGTPLSSSGSGRSRWNNHLNVQKSFSLGDGDAAGVTMEVLVPRDSIVVPFEVDNIGIE